jgi:phosphate butyryltransferase
MYKFEDLFEKVRVGKAKTIAIAGAADAEVLSAISMANKRGMANAILVGDKIAIQKEADLHGIDISSFEIFHEGDTARVPYTAVQLVSSGKADVLMKGLLQTADFFRAVLDPAAGLRIPGQIISSTTVFEIPGWNRFLLLTDVGLIPAPDLETKRLLISNAVPVAKRLGAEVPMVGILCAAENINPKIQATVDADILAKMNEQGDIGGCIVAGPISLDLAISEASARHKGYSHPVAGKADVLIMPNLETGNAVVKAISYFANFKSGVVVSGAARPLVFTSRSDTDETKLNTIALALYLS